MKRVLPIVVKSLRASIVAASVVAIAALAPLRQSATAQQGPTISVSSNVPVEVSNPADLSAAAAFAWNEFIALTWPALPQGGNSFPRGQPDTSRKYGDKGTTGQVVWETFRHKVEVFPGQGNPNGYDSNSPDFGFNARPDYVYASGKGVPPSGEIPPFHSGWNPPSGFPPFNNLDETTQIAQDAMYAGAAGPPSNGGQSTNVNEKARILFEAKVNQVYYQYVAQPRTDQPKLRPYPYSLFQSNTQAVVTIKNNSVNYLNGKAPTPPPPYIQLPASDPQAGKVGAIEVKASFRRLTPAEVKSQRYYTAVVRYYRGDAKGNVTGYVDSNDPQVNETWGLTSLHIIQKTPNAPTFVYATFGQIDNIQDAAGNDVELPNGCTIQQPVAAGSDQCPPVPPGPPVPAFLPPLTITPSANGNPQTVAVTGNGQPPVNTATPQLYFNNITEKIRTNNGNGPNYTLPINVNRRLFPITGDIVAANTFAQAQIKAANPDAVWQYYRLINVQARPLDVTTIVPGSSEETTFYLANEVVETNPELQHFSGTLANGEPTNFNADRTYFKNVKVVQPGGTIARYTMGGCMGCHGTQGQNQGGDFSVLLARGRVLTPDSVDLDPHIEQVRRALARKYLGRTAP
jgi:hypothetical protein